MALGVSVILEELVSEAVYSLVRAGGRELRYARDEVYWRKQVKDRQGCFIPKDNVV